MREIAKGPEPSSLTAHRNSLGNYGNYNDKDALRRKLVKEQRGLCCYCMDRIRDDQDTKIEHWRPQSRYPEQQLVYRNLLAACPGGMGERKRKSQQHCDTHKGSQDLSWNPADPSHEIETRIRYRLDGSIWSDEGAFDAELNNVLNLNVAVLKNHRRGMLDDIAKWYERANERKGATRSWLQHQREKWLPERGELKPYCQIVVWFLDQRFSRLRQ
ncbi:MAG: TIGR02646 family protein [Gammaproteobacteria bacterium]|nr:TIGR02646 family protein [Gammaproteobacteria bacterium]